MNRFVELRHLRYLVAVAEERHFGRAAARLHLAAPSLSKQIRQLEQSLGYELFQRTTREVLLTKPGEAFIAEAREALFHVKRALDHGIAIHRQKSVALTVGYSPLVNRLPLMAAADVTLRETGANVILQTEYSQTQIDKLQAGDIEAGIILMPVVHPDLNIDVLHRETIWLALPNEDDPSGSGQVTFTHLPSRPVVSISRALEPSFGDLFQKLREQTGFVPTAIHEVSSFFEVLELVAGKVGVGFVKSSLATTTKMENVVFRECSDLDLVIEIGIAYRPGSHSQEIDSFVSALRA